jgi:hypothetical protein
MDMSQHQEALLKCFRIQVNHMILLQNSIFLLNLKVLLYVHLHKKHESILICLEHLLILESVNMDIHLHLQEMFEYQDDPIIHKLQLPMNTNIHFSIQQLCELYRMILLLLLDFSNLKSS